MVPIPTFNEPTQSASGHSHVESQNAPLAIVGMGLRLPGGIGNAEQFWDMLANKKDGRCEVPKDRYNIDAFHGPAGKPGTIAPRQGHFIKQGLGEFDAEFFSMSAEQAGMIDPQQRLLAEVVWECMENAGQTNWQSSDIGCYVGTFAEDWMDRAYKDPQHAWGNDELTGAMDFAVANRISHIFDLKGPSETVRTACSSSMVGLDAAFQAISNGDCSSAIVAGCSIMLTPTVPVAMTQGGVLSSNGLCKSFSADADGYARAEAINALYIKPLDAAIRANDPIRAVIRSTATNFDGRTPNIMTPSSDMQERLIRHAYRKADIDPSTTGYIECHATGTAVGDPLEAAAVARIFGDKGVIMGAVKPNLGHSEGASGITGLVKAVLALERRQIPPNIHLSEPNPKIPFEEARLQVPLEVMDWPHDRHVRASVNSFGIGGVNAHAILDGYSAPSARHASSTERTGPQLLTLSAKSARAVHKQASELQKYIQKNPEEVGNIAYTLGLRREHLKYRAFAVVSGASPFSLSEVYESTPKPLSIAFIFTGQGAQWAGMAKELLASSNIFLSSIGRMEKILESLPNAPTWTIRDELRQMNEPSRIDSPEFSQTLCTALQIGVIDMLADWNIYPAAVAGHSSGEIAAAYAAGALTADEAIIIAFNRGQVVKSHTVKGAGAMAAIGLGRDDVSSFIVEGVTIACENSPKSVTLSGDRDKIDIVLHDIQKQRPGTFARRLRVDVAYHSHHMKPLGMMYESLLSERVGSGTPRIPFFSSVSGRRMADCDHFGPSYWRKNLESPVLFSPAVDALLQDKQGQILLEIGPHSALAGPIRQILATNGADKPRYIPALVRGNAQMASLMTVAGNLHSRGLEVDLGKINGTDACCKVLTDLPSYPWNHERSYWKESRTFQNFRFRQFPHHELLGSRILESDDREPSWRNVLNLENVTWLQDHQMDRKVVFPLSGYIAMAGEAVRQISGCSSYQLRRLFVKNPLLLTDSETPEIITHLRPLRLTDDLDSDWFEFTILSFNGTSWTKHCSGQACQGEDRRETQQQIQSFPRKVSSAVVYRALGNIGMNYGPRFQGLHQVTADPVENAAAATVYDTGDSNDGTYPVHPAVIDVYMQLALVAACNGIVRRLGGAKMPAIVENIFVGQGGHVQSLQARSTKIVDGSLDSDVIATSSRGVVLHIQQCRLKPVNFNDDIDGTDSLAGAELQWHPHIELTAHSGMLQPVVSAEARLAAEKLTMLCILDSVSQSKNTKATVVESQRYCDWVKAQSVEISQGKLSIFSESSSWSTLDTPTRQSLISDTAAHLRQTECGPLADAIMSVYQNFSKLLVGDIHGGDIFPNRSHSTNVNDIFGTSINVAKFMASCGHSKPGLRVLELGVGAGNLTSTVITALTDGGVRRYSRYTATDRNQNSLDLLSNRMGEYSNMDYKILDITKDPTEQGFNAGSYDLIIASNTFYTSPRLFTALQNMKELLSAGGILFLQELCGDLLSTSYITGTIPGWWHGVPDVREFHSKSSGWNEELRRAGFTGAETILYDHDKPCEQQACIVSRLATLPSTPAHRATLLYSSVIDESERAVEHYLNRSGYNVTWCALGEKLPSADVVISLLDFKQPFFVNATAKEWTDFQQCLTLLESTRTIWLTRRSQHECADPKYGLTLGVARTVRSELSLDFATLEVDEFDHSARASLVRVIRHLEMAESRGDHNVDMEYILTNGTIQVGRFLPASLRSSLHFEPEASLDRRLRVDRFGSLDTLVWVGNSGESVPAGHIRVKPSFSGLNFKDVLIAMGIVEGSPDRLGLEGSGVVTQLGPGVENVDVGDRVVYLSGDGCFGTSIIVSGKLCAKVPEHLPLEAAATIPLILVTALQGLLVSARLEKGQTVLIHSGAGGVGQAAIQVAKMIGAEVYATAGDDQKREYLTNRFGIPSNRIFDSRSSAFLDGIMRETHGRGVDVVLNSLSGDLLHKSWQCVAKLGTMVEIGKRDFVGHGNLSMHEFADNRSFFGIEITLIAKERPEKIQRLLEQSIELWSQGHVLPVEPRHVFEAVNVQNAFRHLQKGSHMGKTVVRMPENGAKLPVARARAVANLSPDKGYLLVGGLGGIGKSIASWMVENGARHLTFLSRSAGRSEADKWFFEELGVQGCAVSVIPGDVTKLEDVKKAVTASTKPIAGVMQLSMVLRDRPLADMEYADWNATLQPKVTGTWNLHEALGESDLDFFLMMGSVSGLFGSSGQANYNAANTFLDALCKYRQSLGHPASIINLGAMDEIGVVAESPFLLERFASQGVPLLTERDLLDAVQLGIASSKDGAVPTQLNVGLVRRSYQPGQSVSYKEDARFAILHNMRNENLLPTEQGGGTDIIRQLIAHAATDPSILRQDATQELFVQRVKEVLGRLLALPAGELSTTTPLSVVGVDSLVSIEIRRWWRQNLGLEISILEITNAASITHLVGSAIRGLQAKMGHVSK